jgi:hypothetical protein
MREILLLHLSPHTRICACPLPLPQMQRGLRPTTGQTQPLEGRLEEPDSQSTKRFQVLWLTHSTHRRPFLGLICSPDVFTSCASSSTNSI